MEKDRLLKRVNSYFISHTLTKVFSFCLVLLYAFYISPENFGDYEYVQTLINIIVPCSFLCIWEAILKFGLKDKVKKDKVIGTTSLITLIIAVILTIALTIYSLITKLEMLLFVFVTLTFVLDGIRIMWQHYLKILNEYKLYTIASAIGNFVSILTVWILVLGFKLELEALFISSLLGALTNIGIIEFNAHILKYIKKKNIDIALAKKMIKYSMPLVLVAGLTWLVTGLSKAVIQNVISEEANGMYSFAHKFTVIITFVSTILSTAITEELLSLDKEKFKEEFSNVTNKISEGFMALATIVMPAIMVFYEIIQSTEYYESKKYVALLIIYFVFLTLAGHISTVFKVYNRNRLNTLSTFIGAIFTIAGIILSINKFGIMGVVLAQVFGTLVILVLNFIFAQKQIKIKLKSIKLVLILIAYMLVSTASYYSNIYLNLLIWVFTIILFKDNILDIFKKDKGIILRKIYIVIKRIIDVVVSLIGILILWPLFILVAIIIKLDSKGSIFYLQERIKKNGKPFKIIKFRTMVADADEKLKEFSKEQLELYKENYKLSNDPRITRIGKFLRKSGIDELPQLLNVLKGDLSLIGPRPVIREEVERYKENTDKLLSVRPGITGYWCAFCKEDTSYEERMKMELYYVDNLSLGLDLKIVFGTVWTILQRVINKRKV